MTLKAVHFYCLLCCISIGDAVQVTVDEGTLEGATLQTAALSATYYSFKGIPYAKPPVGDLRFMPPQAAEAWDGVRNATEHGSVCPQYDIFSNQYINGSEDCLFLNVYTPDLEPTELYPVVFFIHGGGFKSGSGNVDNYGPDFFIEKNLIVVTINYRLDALGFLCLENEIVSGNMGLKDQVLALKWVNNNIKRFGGNPSSITIMGQSAGSASVALHLISPMTKGLFSRAISMSGSPTSEFAITYKPRLRAFTLGHILGKDTENATELLEFLQSVPAMSIINANAALLGSESVGSSNVLKYFDFVSVTEQDVGREQFLTVDPLKAFMNGDVHEADVLFGVTNEEALTGISMFKDFVIEDTARYREILVPKKILYNCTPDTALDISRQIREYYFGNTSISVENMKAFVKFASETYLSLSVVRFFSYLASSSSHIYSYVFSSFSSRNTYGVEGVPYGMVGAGHVDDLRYLFQPSNMTIDLNSREYKLVNLTSNVFSNFIKYGNPTPDLSLNITWPQYKTENKSYVNIANETLVIGTDYIAESLALFKKIFDSTDTLF